MNDLIELDHIGDLYKIDDFINHCKVGGFLDCDGFGFFANESQSIMSYNIEVRPSKITKTKPPIWATHIIWYNR